MTKNIKNPFSLFKNKIIYVSLFVLMVLQVLVGCGGFLDLFVSKSETNTETSVETPTDVIPTLAAPETGDITNTSITLRWNPIDLAGVKKDDGSQLTAKEVSIDVYYVSRPKGSPAPTVAEILASGNYKTTKGTNTSITLDNLSEATVYYMALKIINEIDQKVVSEGKVSHKYTTLSEATAVEVPAFVPPAAGDVINNSITVKWNALTLANAKKADGNPLTAGEVTIEIYYLSKTKGDAAPSVTEVLASADKGITTGNNTSIALTNLSEETDYYVVLKTINSTDVSMVSNGTVYQKYTTLTAIAAKATAVEVPAFISPAGGDVTNNSITVKWNALTLANAKKADGNPLIAGEVTIEIYYLSKTKGDAAPSVTEVLASADKGTTTGNNTSISLTNLSEGTDYYVVLKTINSTDVSMVSNGTVYQKYTTLTAIAAKATAVAVPAFISPAAGDVTNNSITVKWNALTLANAKKADGNPLTAGEVTIEIYYLSKTKGDAAPSVAEVLASADKGTTTGNNTSIALTNLSEETDYYVVLKTINSTDVSMVSNGTVYQKYTTLTAIAAKATAVAVPAFISPAAGDVTNNSITVKWNALTLANAKKADGNPLTAGEVTIEIYYLSKTKGDAAPSVTEVLASADKGTTTGNNTSISLTNLSEGTDYYVVLKTINSTDVSMVTEGTVYQKYTTLAAASGVNPIKSAIEGKPWVVKNVLWCDGFGANFLKIVLYFKDDIVYYPDASDIGGFGTTCDNETFKTNVIETNIISPANTLSKFDGYSINGNTITSTNTNNFFQFTYDTVNDTLTAVSNFIVIAKGDVLTTDLDLPPMLERYIWSSPFGSVDFCIDSTKANSAYYILIFDNDGFFYYVTAEDISEYLVQLKVITPGTCSAIEIFFKITRERIKNAPKTKKVAYTSTSNGTVANVSDNTFTYGQDVDAWNTVTHKITLTTKGSQPPGDIFAKDSKFTGR